LKEKYYDIHGLLRIYVKGDSQLLSGVDLHIGAFEVTPNEIVNSVRILPYEYLPKKTGGKSSDDWQFIDGYAIRESQRVAFGFEGPILYFYGDRLHVPLNLLLQLALLKVDCTFVHAAGLVSKQKGILLPAAPGTGKTTTVAIMLREQNFLLGDDLCILGKGKIWSYPQSLSIYPYHLSVLPKLPWTIRLNLKFKLVADHLIKNFFSGRSFVSRGVRLIYALSTKPCMSLNPRVVFGDNCVAESANLNSVVLIERNFSYSDLIIQPTTSSVADELTSILWHEWHSYFHELLLFDALLYGPDWLKRLFSQTKFVLNSSFEGIQVERLTIPAHWTAEELSKNSKKYVVMLQSKI
jgi:hypothetical protein